MDIIMPKMGESVSEGTIIKWYKQVGDSVKRDELICEISTDKVDTEIPSPNSGVLSEIKVNEGDTVKLTITSIDVAHGFAITAFGVNSRLNPGQTTTVEFVADKKGTFTFFCSVKCGTGHPGMKGTLIVE